MLKMELAIPHHMKLIKPKAEYKFEGNWRPRLADQLLRSPGFTIFQDNWPVAVMGGNFLNKHVVQVWAVIAPDVDKYPVAFGRMVKKLLAEVAHYHGIHRVQMTTRPDFPRAAEWALALGFKYEGKLTKYGEDGSDFLLFAKVF